MLPKSVRDAAHRKSIAAMIVAGHNPERPEAYDDKRDESGEGEGESGLSPRDGHDTPGEDGMEMPSSMSEDHDSSDHTSGIEGNDANQPGAGHHEAAKEIMEAMRKGDHEGMAASLKNFIEMSKE